MGRTIIQPIGPLYGEVVNGTVFGRPNGSVYVPPTNTITLTLADGDSYIVKVPDGRFYLVDSSNQYKAYSINAASQDIASFIRYALYTDAECTTLLSSVNQEASANLAAGTFNYRSSSYLFLKTEITLDPDATYYFRATLFSSTNVPIAQSEIYEVSEYVS